MVIEVEKDPSALRNKLFDEKEIKVRKMLEDSLGQNIQITYLWNCTSGFATHRNFNGDWRITKGQILTPIQKIKQFFYLNWKGEYLPPEKRIASLSQPVDNEGEYKDIQINIDFPEEMEPATNFAENYQNTTSRKAKIVQRF